MHAQNFSDQQLVSAFLSGDSLSIEHLIIRHKDKIFRFIMSKVQNVDLANDIFQDVFIKVINKLREGRYNEEGKFISWVMRIAHNLVIDHFRKNSRIPKFENSHDFDIFSVLKNTDIDIENKMIKDQIHGEVKKIIEFLPDDQKEVLIYRYYNDLSFKEISEKTGVSINTSLGRMRYALINLRNIIKKKNIILTS